jgi:hypothetical protein
VNVTPISKGASNRTISQIPGWNEFNTDPIANIDPTSLSTRLTGRQKSLSNFEQTQRQWVDVYAERGQQLSPSQSGIAPPSRNAPDLARAFFSTLFDSNWAETASQTRQSMHAT